MGDLLPWLSDHTIRVLTMLGSLGTPLAVAVTVYLAFRSERLRLRIQVDRTLVVSQLSKTQRIRFSITNTGHRLVKVHSVGWVHGPIWRRSTTFRSRQPAFRRSSNPVSTLT